LRFSTGKEVSAHTPYRLKFLSIRHDGPRPRPCAGGGLRGVINNVRDSRSLLITVTVHLTSTRLVVEDCWWQARLTSELGLYVCDKALHARFAIVEPTATMLVKTMQVAA